MRRLLPTIALFGAGLLLLLWGLATLEGIVIEERREAKARLADANQTLAEYARRAIEGELSAALHAVEPELAEAEDNPFIPAGALLLIDRGAQVLPRRTSHQPGDTTPGRELYLALRTGDLDDIEAALADDADAPLARRLALHEAVLGALRAGDDAAVEDAVREVFQHRARWVLESVNDVPATLAMLDDLYEFATPDETMAAKLLRDGMGEAPSVRREGLQQQLLQRRGQFTEADFRFLAGRVIALSERAAVEVTDFEAQATALPAEHVAIPASVRGPVLADAGRWFAEPRPGRRIVGMAVDLAPYVAAVEQEMRDRGLLEDDDSIALPALGELSAVADVQFVVTAPRLAMAAVDADRRLSLKTTFVGFAGAMALIIAVLAVVLQHKSSRFVELKSEFVAMVSHELRTPLASIRLMAETVQRRTADVPRVKDYPERIVAEIDELSFLVENILSFNRLDKGRWEPRRSELGLAELLDEIVDSLERYGFSGVQLTTEGIDGMVLSADRELIKLLLRNLIKNACTYNERMPIEVRVAAQRTAGRLVLRVSDNGVGIEPAQHRRIFEDFRRGGQSRARGSGLGLSICRKSAQAHGGRIEVEESSAAGTVFRIELPASIVVH